jgi:hypothetical protein
MVGSSQSHFWYCRLAYVAACLTGILQELCQLAEANEIISDNNRLFEN